MSKIITTTFLLKNPAKVREMVAKGMKLLVKHNGKIVMQITIPAGKTEAEQKAKFPPSFKSKVKYSKNTTFSREDIYSGKYD